LPKGLEGVESKDLTPASLARFYSRVSLRNAAMFFGVPAVGSNKSHIVPAAVYKRKNWSGRADLNLSRFAGVSEAKPSGSPQAKS
jgi:hypothetical protein